MKRRVIAGLVVLFCFGAAGIISCRTESSEKVKIESIKFQESSKTVKLQEEVTIGVTVSPENAKKTNVIAYSASTPGVIEINQSASGNDGVVFRAVGYGSTVILAKSGGVIDYCDVIVEGPAEDVIPYISVSTPVIEIPVNQKRSVVVNLQGGTPADNGGFVWYNLNTGALDVNFTGNVGVIEGLQKGSGKIRVSHPRAQYNVEVLAFVLGIDEMARYITAKENVLVLTRGEEKDFLVSLVGCSPADVNRMMWEIVEGVGLITMVPSGDSCRIRAVGEGTATIRVTNTAVEYPFEFQVIVSRGSDGRYIELDDNFIILNGAQQRNIVARFNGEAPSNVYDKYTYSVSNEGVISVQQVQNIFRISPLEIGSVVLTINNEYSEFPRDVLVMVESFAAVDLKKYITTSQNIVYMEVDGEALLTMTLVGGNEADKDGFEWEVSDYTLLEAASGHGNVRYRAMYVDTGNKFEAQAFLTAKRAGTVTIKIRHEKAEYDCTVLVKIFRKGTFNNNMLSIGGPGFISIREGETENVRLSLLGGGIPDTGLLSWTVEDENKATAEGSGLYGIVKGLRKGVTRLKVDGAGVFERYEGLVVVNGSDGTDDIPYIYVNNVMHRLYVGQTVVVPILHPNIPAEAFEVDMLNTGMNTVYAVISRDVLVLNAVGEGSCEIKISGKNGSYANDITVYVTVEGQDVNPDRPYILTGDNFIGIVKGQNRTYTVSLAGSNANDQKGIIWSADDSGIVSLNPNGKEVIISGLKEGQTYINVEHAKASNRKKVAVYVVGDVKDLNKIVIGAEKTSYIINPGETVYLKLITNAAPDQKKNLIWSLDNLEIVYLQDNFDSAVFTALNVGTCKITVKKIQDDVDKTEHVLPLEIYVTVRSPYDVSDVALPVSVALLVGERKTIKLGAVGLSESELQEIQWSVEEPVVTLLPNGNEMVVIGEVKGQTFINVSYARINLYKRILVVCAASEAELEEMYWFSVDRSLFRISKDDQITVSLIFGQTGFPEDEKLLIKWEDYLNNGVIEVLENRGSRGVIAGKNEGVATVRISSGKALKDIDIQIEVTDRLISGDTKFLYRGMHVIDRGVTADIPISLYQGDYHEHGGDDEAERTNILETGYGLIEVINHNSNIVDAVMAGKVLRIRALEYGKAVVTLRHREVKEDARITVVVSNDGNAMTVSVRKTHYLVDVGNVIEVELETSHSDQARISQISWNGGGSVITIDDSARTKASVTAVREGNAVIQVMVSGIVQETVYVSVRGSQAAAQYTVSTESIIALVTGDSRYTNIIVSGENARQFYWEDEDKGVIRIAGYGRSCYITALEAGVEEITVSDGLVKRTIVVYVRDTRAELENVSMLNIDRRDYRIGLGETVILQPYFYMERPNIYIPSSFEPFYKNRVVDLAASGNRAEITGKNEGIEKIKIFNAQCGNSIEVTVEVTALRAEVGNNTNMVYMTTADNVILLGINDTDILIQVRTAGGYQGREADFNWKKSNNNISLTSYGSNALVSALGKKGETVITVTNPYCDNDLTILVNVNDQFISKEYTKPYIWTEKTVYTTTVGSGVVIINYELRNIEGLVFDENASLYATGGGILRVGDITHDAIVVRVSSVGTGELVIGHTDGRIVNNVKIFIIVNASSGNSAIFLTTGQNYVITQKSSNVLVSVNLAGYNELNSEKIKWRSDNKGVAYVVGNGFAVQVHGVGVGITNIYASHEESYNELKIVVKVVEAETFGNICYLTTGDNVIETYVSSLNNQIIVNKVGGGYVQSAVWTVDDPAVATVMGMGLTAYFTAKKAGTVKITVSEAEAGSLEIVMVVRQAKPGTEYIATGEPVIMMPPGTGGRNIAVELVGGTEQDARNFVWTLYSQSPADIEVARMGGSVISLYANGPVGSVTALYPGTARIKVTHPKANDILYIMVLVTNYNNLSFVENSITMLKEDNEFTALNIPNYENLEGRLIVETNNADVVTVTRAGKIILLSSKKSGNALVTARIANTDLRAELPVIVEDRINEDDIFILMQETMITFNPYSSARILSAQLLGGGLTASASDDLVWKVHDNESGYLVVTPKPSEKDGYSRGSQIQVAPRVSASSALPQYLRIEVSDGLGRTDRRKNVIVFIAEEGNSFTLNKTGLRIEPGKLETVEANIAGASSRDYDEIVWYLERDKYNPNRETARMMGSGRAVQILGMADGLTTLVAVYRGRPVTCEIRVESPQFFEISYNTYRMYPGETSSDNDSDGFFKIPFTLRPRDGNVRWYVSDDAIDPKVNWYVKNPQDISSDITAVAAESQGYICVKPLKEGNVIITGQLGSMVSSVDIIIQYNFTAYFTPVRLEPVVLSKVYASGQKSLDAREQGASYQMFPPNSFLRLENAAGWEQRGVQVSIGSVNRGTGRGMVTLNYYNEIYNRNNVNDKAETLVFGQYIREDGKDKPTGKIAELKVQVMYNNVEQRIIPVFQRTFGQYSNRAGINSSGILDKPQAYVRVANHPSGNNYDDRVNNITGMTAVNSRLGAGTTLPRVTYNTATGTVRLIGSSGNVQIPTTGSLYDAGEFITINEIYVNPDDNNNNMTGGDFDRYEMVIGDGEEHYIMFDPVAYNMDYEIQSIEVDAVNIKTEGNNGRGITAEPVHDERNRITGLRLSGGKDFVVYSNVGSMYDLEIDIECDHPNTGGGRYFNPEKVQFVPEGQTREQRLRYILPGKNINEQNIVAFVEKNANISREGHTFAAVLEECNYYDNYVYPVNSQISLDNANNNVIRLVYVNMTTTLTPTHNAGSSTTLEGCYPFGYIPAGEWTIYKKNGVSIPGGENPPYPLVAHNAIGGFDYDYGTTLKTTWRPLMVERGLEYEFGGYGNQVRGPLNNKIILLPTDISTSIARRTYSIFGIPYKRERKVSFGNFNFLAYDYNGLKGMMQPFTRVIDNDITHRDYDNNTGLFGEYYINSFDYAIYARDTLQDIHIINFMEGIAEGWDIKASEKEDNINDAPSNRKYNLSPVVKPGNINYNRIRRSNPNTNGMSQNDYKNMTKHEERKGRLHMGPAMLSQAISIMGPDTANQANLISAMGNARTGMPYYQENNVYLDFTFKGFVKNQYTQADNFFPVMSIEGLSNFPFGFVIDLNEKKPGEKGYNEKLFKKYTAFDCETLKFDDDLFMTKNTNEGFDEAEYDKIKGTNVFFPVATNSTGVVKIERNYGRVIVKYNTARGPKYVNIDLHYEIRASHAGYRKDEDKYYIKAPGFGTFDGNGRSEYLRKITDQELLNDYNIRLLNEWWGVNEVNNLYNISGTIYLGGRTVVNPENVSMKNAFYVRDNELRYRIDVDY
jgi:acetolactate synthase small subunit